MGVATLFTLLAATSTSTSTGTVAVDDGDAISRTLETRPLGPVEWRAFAALPGAEQPRVVADLRGAAPKSERGRVTIAWLTWIAEWRDPPEPRATARAEAKVRDAARADNFAAGVMSKLRRGRLGSSDLKAFARLTDWEQALIVDALVAAEPRTYEMEKAAARLDEVRRRLSERTAARSPGWALARYCIAALDDGRTPARREWIIFGNLPGPERRIFLDTVRERLDDSPDAAANFARFEWIDARPTAKRVIRSTRTEPYVSPGTALGVSAGVTGGLLLGGLLLIPISDSMVPIGILLATIGLTFGPSAGYFYIGEAGHATLFAVLRLVSFVPAGILALIAEIGDAPSSERRPMLALATASLAVSLGLAVWDFVTVRGAAEQKNKAHGVVLAPSAVLDHDGRVAPALALSLRF